LPLLKSSVKKQVSFDKEWNRRDVLKKCASKNATQREGDNMAKQKRDFNVV